MSRKIYADKYVLPREDTMTIVPAHSRGMKDENPEVRSMTSRAMLAERYAHTPKFRAKCAYPPCQTVIEGYDRNGKRRKFCTAAHNTADCRRRQREQGIRRVTIGGVVRMMHVEPTPPMQQAPARWPRDEVLTLPPPVPRRPRQPRQPHPVSSPPSPVGGYGPVTSRTPRSWKPVGGAA